MCTVSFIPSRDKFIITSNRDEKNQRTKAFAPKLYRLNGEKLIFPKDGEAGGTWIALKENGDVAVLLNGAFISHVPEPPYKKSRGLELLDILSQDRPSFYISKKNFENIEPFTIVLFESGCLYEFRWDGTERYYRQLSVLRPHIWSSATLYDGLEAKKREQWLAAFLNSVPSPTQLDILNFHRSRSDDVNTRNLILNRDGIYSTVSITSILLTSDRGSMKYLDLAGNLSTEVKLELTKTIKI